MSGGRFIKAGPLPDELHNIWALIDIVEDELRLQDKYSLLVVQLSHATIAYALDEHYDPPIWDLVVSVTLSGQV